MLHVIYDILNSGSTSRTFVEHMISNGIKTASGEGKYYQLTKKEGTINPYKKACIVVNVAVKGMPVVADSRKTSAKDIYTAIGLSPTTSPSELDASHVPSGFALFVASTSPNRKVEPNTLLIITDAKKNAAGAAPAAAAPAAALAAAKTTAPTTVTAGPSAGKRHDRSPTHSAAAQPPTPATTATTTLASSKAIATNNSNNKNKQQVSFPFSESNGPWTNVGPAHLCPGWFWVNQLWITHTGHPDNKSLSALPLPPKPGTITKIASFDYDGCLANTSLFKKGPDAWSVLFPSIPAVLKELRDKGYLFVIMSNQAEIGKSVNAREKLINEKKGRFEGFVKQVGEPCVVMAGTASTKDESDKYRKPRTGMWDFFESHLNNGVAIDRKKSFFVGDAAGRKKDHSDTDKKYAAAVGVTFFTEDECFKNNAYRSLF